ncbi:MAG: hypothetical protein M1834_009702 [Cirrosporium novae-zelandiae]|nr:MAG: hypothetical protein M1834_009702 [Cirrosporium novae-zelandiae]
MSSKKNAYNSTTSDTSFRRTWDKSEYAAKAATNEAKSREESKARYEAKLAGHKYIPRPSTPPDAKETAARARRLDVSANVGKTMLVPAGAAIGKRGKGAGFYCADCDLTFKDNLQFVDHLNSRQHLVATGQTGDVRRATLEDVRERLRWLKAKREEEEREKEGVDLQERLKRRIEDEEREREERREKRREKRRRAKEEKGVKVEEEIRGGIIC